MAKQRNSELNELLKLLRRIVVLAVAAYGLYREMPYLDLGLRLAELWGVLYLSSLLLDIVVSRLSLGVATMTAEHGPSADAAPRSTGVGAQRAK